MFDNVTFGRFNASLCDIIKEIGRKTNNHYNVQKKITKMRVKCFKI